MIEPAVRFTKFPPFNSLNTARNKIYALADRPWSTTMTIEEVKALFDEHLNEIVRRERTPKLKAALDRIVVKLCRRFEESEDWQIAQKVALAVRGASLWTETSDSSAPLALLPTDILARIMYETVIGETDDLAHFASVSRKWHEGVRRVYPALSDWMFRLHRFETPRVLPAVENLWFDRDCSFSKMESILKQYPRLKSVKIDDVGNDFDLDRVNELCPMLQQITFKQGLYPSDALDLSQFRALKEVYLDRLGVDILILPPSIEVISIKDNTPNGRFPLYWIGPRTMLVPEEARVQELSIERGDIRSLDFRGEAWKSLKHLSMKACGSLDSLHFPQEWNELESLTFSSIFLIQPRIHLLKAPKLKEVKIEYADVELFLPDVPELTSLQLEPFHFMQAALGIRSCPNLVELNLQNVIVHALPLPETLEILGIRRSRIESTSFPKHFPYLIDCVLLQITGLPKILPLAASKKLEACNIENCVGVETVKFPEQPEMLSELYVCQEEEPLVVEGLRGGFYNLRYDVTLKAPTLLGLESIDFSAANRVKRICISNAPQLTSIQLPRRSPALRGVELNGVNLSQLDTTSCSLIHLEQIKIRNQEEFKVSLGRHPKLKEPVVEIENPAPLKKQKVDI